jgi:hypothetical protein
MVQRGVKFRPIVALAAFNLDGFGDQLPVAVVQELLDGFALPFDAKTAFTLLAVETRR